jgi:P-type Cu+ transporter
MVGDGLNDAGALQQSNVGIVISDNTNNFSPACDAILDGENTSKLYNYIAFAHTSQQIISVSFIISILYNIIGVGFAISGNLQPVIAAILMPISSITMVLFTTGATNLMAKRLIN